MLKCLLDRRRLVSVVTILTLCLGLCSCETLKKKFTRQKKGGDQVKDFQPVLEPQEYPTPENNPIFSYMQHYDLIKAWYRDLWTGIDEKNNDGSVKYSIRQILDHIDQMKPLLKAEKSSELDRLAGFLKYYQDSLSQPRNMRNYSRIQSDLRAFDRLLRSKLRNDRLKGYFINQ